MHVVSIIVRVDTIQRVVCAAGAGGIATGFAQGTSSIAAGQAVSAILVVAASERWQVSPELEGTLAQSME